MAPDDHSGGARPGGPVVLRIKLRYDDLDAMVQRFAPNVGKSGLFLPTKSIQPIGTEVKFELRLANDTPALVGIGRVKHVKHPDPKQPKAAFGMAIELMRVSREGREVIIRMIERRRAMGLADVAIPIPEDVEASRRAELESQPRADTSGIVREAMAQFASAPVAEAILTGPPPPSVRDSGLVPVAPPVRESAPQLLTAPRSTDVSKPVPVLAPEPVRPKRPRIHDVIAKAGESAPVVAIAELDEHVDVERALARARALATGDLDAELAAVRESAAAPIEISIEAASAELARQLGGKPTTKRDRSARWAPPPPVEPAPVVEPEPDDDAFAVNASTTTAVEPAPVEPADISAFDRPYSEGERINTNDVIAIEPDEVEELEPEPAGDRTQIGQWPEAHTEHEQLADQLDRQLDEAEQAEEADIAESLAREPSYNPYEAAPADEEPPDEEPADEEVSDLDVLAEADENDADLLNAPQAYGEQPAYAAQPEYGEQPQYDQPTGYDAQQVDDGGDSGLRLPTEYPAADSGYDDGHDEQPAAVAYQEPPEPDLAYAQTAYAGDEQPAARPSSNFDFASRLDLDDSLDRVLDSAEEELGFDAEAAREFDREAAREFDAERPRNLDSVLDERPLPPDLELDEDDDPANEFLDDRTVGAPPNARVPRMPSEGAFDDAPSSSYTFAEQFPQAGLQGAERAQSVDDFDDQSEFAPAPVQPPPAQSKRPTADDLEDALAALDVDVEDGVPMKRPSSVSGPRPLPGLPEHRPASGPVRTIAHTVARSQAGTPTMPLPPGRSPAPVAPPSTGRTQSRPMTMPPPVPAAALRPKPATQQVPVAPAPKRATTDEGILIEFDDDDE